MAVLFLKDYCGFRTYPASSLHIDAPTDCNLNFCVAMKIMIMVRSALRWTFCFLVLVGIKCLFLRVFKNIFVIRNITKWHVVMLWHSYSRIPLRLTRRDPLKLFVLSGFSPKFVKWLSYSNAVVNSQIHASKSLYCINKSIFGRFSYHLNQSVLFVWEYWARRHLETKCTFSPRSERCW